MRLGLIVEDERPLREGLASAISAAGHRVFTADGLDEALKILERDVIGCVLLDLRLRDRDGITARPIRRDDLRDVPVVIATAYGHSERTIEACVAGCLVRRASAVAGRCRIAESDRRT